MRTSDLIHETYTALTANKVRTGLTMLGIIIGIGSVIALVSIGQGAQKSIQDRIESIGSNLIIIMPGAQGGVGQQVSQGRGTAKTLTSDDADAIATQVTLAKAVSPELTSRHQVTAKGTNTNTTITGATDAYPEVHNVEIDQGTFITESQNQSLAKVAVLGPTTVTDLFPDGTDPIGQVIRINGLQFKVVGTTVAKGGSGFGSQDDMVYIPLKSAQQYLAGDQYVSDISVEAQDSDSMTEAQNEITDLLLARHHISNAASADFQTLNQNDIVATASSVTQTFTIFLGAVAGISLLVGGIGIMNMMLTTVTERTREIGLRKAIGAKRADINRQFLVEAVSLTVIGGLIGVLLGSLISFGINKLGVLETSVSLGSIGLAFGVSAFIGIVFGYYPARRAAALNPIDALRYE